MPAENYKRTYIEQKTEFSDLLAHVKFWKGKKKCIPIVLAGPPGTGKSTFIEDLAKELDCEYQEINGHSGLCREDVEGVPVLINGNSSWKDGAIPVAIKTVNRDKLVILAINEYNLIRPEVQASTNSLLDYQGRFRLTTNANELFEIDEGCTLVVIATMNENLEGVFRVQGSVLSRIMIWIGLDYAPKALESKIITMVSGIDKRISNIVCDAASELRRAATKADATIERAISTRELISFCESIMVPGSKLETMFDYTICNKLIENEKERRAIYTLIDEGKNFFGKIRDVLNPPKIISTPTPTPTPIPSNASRYSSDPYGIINVKNMNYNGEAMTVFRFKTYRVNQLPRKVEYNGEIFRIQRSGTHNPMNRKIGKIQTKANELIFFTKKGYTRSETLTERSFVKFIVKN